MQEQQKEPDFIRIRLARRRRAWWVGMSLVGGLLLLGTVFSAQYLWAIKSAAPLAVKTPTPEAVQDLSQFVNPFIGTTSAPQNLALGSGFDSGNVFPGAVVPRGMVQWSPDTTNQAGGYRYDQTTIQGFSLTHFSGRGCSAYQDFPFLPSVGALPNSPFLFSDYATPFSHQQESASPGYYSVHLPAKDVQVELTATLRTGFARFTYPTSRQALLFINVGGSANGDSATGTSVQIVGQNEVIGQATSGHFCTGGSNSYTVYFAAQFDQPFTALGTWQGTLLSPGTRASSGSQAGAYLQFDTTHSRTVQVRVGLSFVSTNNALLNLQRENPTWDFVGVRAQARTAWNDMLNSIQVQGGSQAEQETFYTALYHTFIHPNVFSDVNGEYIGFDKKMHLAEGYTQYENFPGWDMYRSLIPLLAILEPQVVGDMLQSLVEDAEQGGGGLPRWEVANDNSGGMVGDPMDAVIATSYALGVRNFDTQAALQAMELGASDVNARAGSALARVGLGQYLSQGYISTSIAGSASMTLEYALDDYAIARFASALGEQQTAQSYLSRSHNWQNLFDAQTGYIVPRQPGGAFLSGFTPQSDNGFVESSSATYSWMVPQDLPDLLSRLGGNSQVVMRLDQHFQELNAGTASLYAFMGNEPEFGVPWIYNFAGRPDRTQGVVRRIQTQLFAATPDGLPGNDDGGALSSWYIFSALGFYPEIPGVAGFALGSPLFPQIQLHLGSGTILTIMSRGAADTSPYVQSASLNQHAWSNPWLPWSAIQDGGTLAFALGSQANLHWSTPIRVS